MRLGLGFTLLTFLASSMAATATTETTMLFTSAATLALQIAAIACFLHTGRQTADD